MSEIKTGCFGKRALESWSWNALEDINFSGLENPAVASQRLQYRLGGHYHHVG